MASRGLGMCALRSRLLSCQGSQGAHSDACLSCTIEHSQVAEHGNDHASELGEYRSGYVSERANKMISKILYFYIIIITTWCQVMRFEHFSNQRCADATRGSTTSRGCSLHAIDQMMWSERSGLSTGIVSVNGALPGYTFDFNYNIK